MKSAVLFIVIFGLGALFYALVTQFFATPAQNVQTEDDVRTPTTTSQEVEEQSGDVPQEEEEIETPVVITEDGSLLDGPFVIFNQDEEKTEATVRIVRSPEEMLLQFENWDLPHAAASHVYFASDKEATTYFNLGPAKMSEAYLIYGIPLDAQLEEYQYILIYQTQTDEVEYYAKIR